MGRVHRPGRRAALAALALAPWALRARSPRPRKRVALVGFREMFGGGDGGLEAVADQLARRSPPGFCLNAATAARLGMKVAPDLRLRADRVIE